jgi:ribosomal protein L23
VSLIIPRVSEKTFLLSQTRNTYVFNVPADMNKLEVAKEVKKQYDVNPLSVRIVVAKGRAVRFIRRGGRMNTGVRQDVKKAYVRLPEGQTIPVFASLTEQVEETAAAPVANAKKRGLFARSNEKASKTSTASPSVTRTQAKVGEK